MAGAAAAGGSFLPYLMGKVQNDRQGKAQARLLNDQADTVDRQTYADEDATRRESRQFLGAQAAAMAEAGGAGGSNAMLARQSAALAELDALNVRYRGQQAAYGLRKEAAATRKATRFSSPGLMLLRAGYKKVK